MNSLTHICVNVHHLNAFLGISGPIICAWGCSPSLVNPTSLVKMWAFLGF